MAAGGAFHVHAELRVTAGENAPMRRGALPHTDERLGRVDDCRALAVIGDNLHAAE